MTSFHTADRRRMHLSMILDILVHQAPTEDGRAASWVDIEETGLPLPYLYVLADLLEWLGLIERYKDSLVLRVVSPNAAYALRILSDLLSQKKPLFDWLTTCSGRAFLAALECLRIRLLTPQGAAAVRELQVAIALISHQAPHQRRTYLLVFDEEAGEWQAPGGRYELSDLGLRQTLLRELQEELGLDISSSTSSIVVRPLGTPFHLRRISPSRGILTDTLFHPFLVTLPHATISMHANLYWATSHEIMRGRTDHGQRINKQMIQPLLLRLPISLEQEEQSAFHMAIA